MSKLDENDHIHSTPDTATWLEDAESTMTNFNASPSMVSSVAGAESVHAYDHSLTMHHFDKEMFTLSQRLDAIEQHIMMLSTHPLPTDTQPIQEVLLSQTPQTSKISQFTRSRGRLPGNLPISRGNKARGYRNM